MAFEVETDQYGQEQQVFRDKVGNVIHVGDVVAWPASYNGLAMGLVETLDKGTSLLRVWPLWKYEDHINFVKQKGMRRQKVWKLHSVIKVVKEEDEFAN